MIPRPAPPRRFFALAWLMCRAFAPNRLLAVLAYPLGLLMLVPYAVRRQLYGTSDRNGLVVFGPFSLVKDALIIAAVMAPFFVLFSWASDFWGLIGGLVFLVALTSILLAGLFAFGSSSMGVPVGRETPKGDRYQIAALAQRPGTRLSAIQLALQLWRRIRDWASLTAVAVVSSGHPIDLAVSPGHRPASS